MLEQSSLESIRKNAENTVISLKAIRSSTIVPFMVIMTFIGILYFFLNYLVKNPWFIVAFIIITIISTIFASKQADKYYTKYYKNYFLKNPEEFEKMVQDQVKSMLEVAESNMVYYKDKAVNTQNKLSQASIMIQLCEELLKK